MTRVRINLKTGNSAYITILIIINSFIYLISVGLELHCKVTYSVRSLIKQKCIAKSQVNVVLHYYEGEWQNSEVLNPEASQQSVTTYI